MYPGFVALRGKLNPDTRHRAGARQKRQRLKWGRNEPKKRALSVRALRCAFHTPRCTFCTEQGMPNGTNYFG